MPEISARMVQFVWFVTDTAHLTADALYSQILGTEPVLAQTNKIPSATMPFTSSAKRTDDGVTTTLNVVQGRVDLFFTPDETVPVERGGVSELDARSVIGNALGNFKRANFEALGGIYRVAVVVNYSDSRPDQTSVAKDFFGFIGTSDLSAGGEYISDLLFRINKRKRFDEISLMANRLVQISTETIQEVEIGLNNISRAPSQGSYQNELFYLMRSVDINSVVDSGDLLVADGISNILEAFCSESLKIANAMSIDEI